jgi:hypothetical protein
MPKERFSAEKAVTLLRQVEVLMMQGKSASVACRKAVISQQNSAMNCSTAKSSTASTRHRSSSSNDESTTAQSDRAHPPDIDHPHRRPRTRSRRRWIMRPKCNYLPIPLVQKMGHRKARGTTVVSTFSGVQMIYILKHSADGMTAADIWRCPYAGGVLRVECG